ncbi:MAG: hypothetical protein WC843_03980 [Candidatus Gracilibacteria bacterium]|jgi:hypothetical protein
MTIETTPNNIKNGETKTSSAKNVEQVAVEAIENIASISRVAIDAIRKITELTSTPEVPISGVSEASSSIQHGATEKPRWFCVTARGIAIRYQGEIQEIREI